MNTDFLAELGNDLIHFRDHLQFELKSEFELNSKSKNNIFTQEFYIFIPEALQTNAQTYSADQFYKDETNLIRYKTPIFSFNELLNQANLRSPLNRLRSFASKVPFSGQQDSVSDEAKLFGNIFRSTLRREIEEMVQDLQKEPEKERFRQLSSSINQLCSNIEETQKMYREVQVAINEKAKATLITRNLSFVDEFLCDIADYYLSGLLDILRSSPFSSLTEEDKKICTLILVEKKYKEQYMPKGTNQTDPELQEESVLYRKSLLQKFLMESLQLKSSRIALAERHGPFIGAIAAGVAMLLYMILFLFVWKTPTLLINSIPFVLSVVFFYILKDRVKEGMKSYYRQKAFKWFPDYQTEIFSQHDKPIGVLSESFSFLNQHQLPQRIQQLRSQDSDILDTLNRHEAVIFYKREVLLYPNEQRDSARRHHLSTIFRFNVRHLVEKASDALTTELDLDPKTLTIKYKELPKIYHINIVLKNIHSEENGEESRQTQKYRIIINKEGIKRVEYLGKY